MVHLIVTVTGAHWAPDLRRARTGNITGGRATLTVARSGFRISRKTIALFTLFNPGMWLFAAAATSSEEGNYRFSCDSDDACAHSSQSFQASSGLISSQTLGLEARNMKRIWLAPPQIQEQIVEVVVVMLQELVQERVVEQNASCNRSCLCHRFWSRMLK